MGYEQLASFVGEAFGVCYFVLILICNVLILTISKLNLRVKVKYKYFKQILVTLHTLNSCEEKS